VNAPPEGPFHSFRSTVHYPNSDEECIAEFRIMPFSLLQPFFRPLCKIANPCRLVPHFFYEAASNI